MRPGATTRGVSSRQTERLVGKFDRSLRRTNNLFVEKFGADKWLSVPYIEVRKRYQEIPDDKTLIILCDAGTRSSEVQVFLDHIGKTNSLVLGGGFNVIRRLGADWLPQ